MYPLQRENPPSSHGVFHRILVQGGTICICGRICHVFPKALCQGSCSHTNVYNLEPDVVNHVYDILRRGNCHPPVVDVAETASHCQGR